MSLSCGIENSQTQRNRGIEWLLPEAEGWRKWGDVGQSVWTSSCKINKFGNLMHSLVRLEITLLCIILEHC